MRFFLQLIAATVILGGTIFIETSCIRREQQPIYNGKSLSAWLRDVSNEKPNHKNDQAREAIRQIGTNALPFLLKEISDPGEIWNQISRTNSYYKTHEAFIRRTDVGIGFKTLGPIAKPAIPVLVDLLNNGNNPSSAADALVGIDSHIAAVALTGALTNKSMECRVAAAAYLVDVGTNADIAVPNLILCLRHEPRERGIMAATLGEIHARSDIAVPPLVEMLSDKDLQARVESVRALGQFGNKATSAVSSLEQATNGADQRFCAEVAAALEKIQSIPQ